MKRNVILIIAVIVSLLVGGVLSNFIFGTNSDTNTILKELPAQEKSEGLRGVYDIDKNINEKTIDNYLYHILLLTPLTFLVQVILLKLYLYQN